MNAFEFPDRKQGFDTFTLVALLLFVFGGWALFRDISATQASDIVLKEEQNFQPLEADEGSVGSVEKEQSKWQASNEGVDENMVAAPYDHYVLTQGPHGYSYGHMAVDLAAGKGEIIKSPIHGLVTDRYVDQYGNPTLVIENDLYQVTMLHGKYKVDIGERVTIGQMVGRESNLGYTMDIWGRSCRNRECGYHTHLNIYDKRAGSNINPLDVIR